MPSRILRSALLLLPFALVACMSGTGSTDEGERTTAETARGVSGQCGARAGIPCKKGQQCVVDTTDDCDEATTADCPGMCVTDQPASPFSCAGFLGIACPEAPNSEQMTLYACVDDFRDDCDPENGGADCSGLCVAATGPQYCGSSQSPPCAAGLICVFNPYLACAAPAEHVADCDTGICALAAPGTCDSTLKCGDALTCVGGFLYPTTCGPTNCDAPIDYCKE
jgi:hypothetical protein